MPWRLFKIALALALMAALYYQLFVHTDARALFEAFQKELQWSRLPLLLLALGLAPFNWALETLKWREFTDSFSQESFLESYRAVLAGVAVSLLTPNRIGEYGGRMLLADRRHIWQTGISTLLGGLAQMIILFSAGILGLGWLGCNHFGWKTYHLLSVTFAGLIGTSLLLATFFRLRHLLPIIRWCVGARFWIKIRRPAVVLSVATDRQRWRALGWAFLRYTVYSLQYWLLMQVMGANVALVAGLAAIATIFLIQTGLPLPLLGVLAARAEIALWIWGRFNVNEISVLAATFGLFIINLALPALPGAIFIVKGKTKKH